MRVVVALGGNALLRRGQPLTHENQQGNARAACRALAEGSMGPKVRPARQFVDQTGGFAAIGSINDAEALLAGSAGTRISADANGPAVDAGTTRSRSADGR